MILRVVLEGISKVAAVISVLMKVCTIRCHDRGYINVFWFYKSAILPLLKFASHSKHLPQLMVLISIHTSYHFRSLRCILAEFHAELDVFSLFQFHIHAEITIVKERVVTNTCVVQLPLFTQWCHMAYWVAMLTAPKHSACIHLLPSFGFLWK